MAFLPVGNIAPNYRDFKTYWFKAYEPGTTTPKTIALDSSGSPTAAKLQLDKDGFIESSGNAIVMPYLEGNYDAYLFPTEAEADDNKTANATQIADNLSGSVTESFIIGEFERRYQDTLIDWQNDETVQENDVVIVKERATGQGGSFIGDVVLTSSVTPNGFNIITSIADGTLSIVIRVGKNIDLTQWGAVDGVDVSPIIVSAATQYSLPMVLSKDVLCSEVTGVDYINLVLNNAVINNTTSDNCFRNIKDFRLSGKGLIGNVTPYNTYFYTVETGNNLDVLKVSGDISISCQNTSTTAFWCDAGVTATVAPDVNITGIEITGFERSGIELAMDADLKESSFYVARVKSHSGKGRCIQFGDNENGCWNVIVEDCPRLGDVSSTGSSEAHGVIVYGENVDISNNVVENVKNESASGGEGLYVKSSFCTIMNNKLKNAGSSSDGCITIKGAEYYDSSVADEGEFSIISGNTIRMTDSTYDSKGIGIFDNNVICTDNILRDMRSDRNTLTYSMAISVAGSEDCCNVLVANNKSIGWVSFCGDFDESFKGRSRFGDNITIQNNICINLIKYGVMWRSDAGIKGADMTFSSTGNTITIDGGASQNAQFNPCLFAPGKVIVITSGLNNGVFTVATVDRYTLTTVEAIVNESSVSTTIARQQIENLKITGNTFQGGTFAIRNFSNKVENLVLEGNTYQDYTTAYRLDQTNGIGTLTIGNKEQFINVTNIQSGIPVADDTRRGVVVTDDAGSNLTVESYNTTYTVAYT